MRRSRHRTPILRTAQSTVLTAPQRHSESFLDAQPTDPFAIHCPVLTTQERGESSIPEARMSLCKSMQRPQESTAFLAQQDGPVADRRAVQPKRATDLTLGSVELLAQMPHRPTPTLRA